MAGLEEEEVGSGPKEGSTGSGALGFPGEEVPALQRSQIGFVLVSV